MASSTKSNGDGPKLVVVESPAKARTIGRILQGDYVIKASKGHVRDLPKKKLGIDLKKNFAPQYDIVPEKEAVVSDLKKAAREASSVYLATDPDREGEAISWHILQAMKLTGKTPIHRVVFHEITPEAVTAAFRHPRDIDMNLVDAQQARRVLDRLVGYKLSPLLWRKIQRGLSAGRVQSAAVRIVVDREREIRDFKQTEYWTIDADLEKAVPPTGGSFRASLTGIKGKTKLEMPNQAEADRLLALLKPARYKVETVQTKQSPRNPAAPFTTSTLQQEAWRKLRFTAERTMSIAQQLYEGINVGAEGSVGLITYMRTDSTHVAPSALHETREFINESFGPEYLPPHERVFSRKGKFTQEAHEAIRPTRIHRIPAQLKDHLDSAQYKLYELIWKRMVASQMASARFENTTVIIEAAPAADKHTYLFRAVNSDLKFPGFIAVYEEGKDDADGEARTSPLPHLEAADPLNLLDLRSQQNFTQPLPRYTEATLVKALEQRGIGRPSTYAPILSTIQKRGYVHKEQGKFHADELGMVVTDMLTKHFPRIVDLDFTAQMEGELDSIAQGKEEWVPVMQKFYDPFSESLARAATEMEKVEVDTGEACPKCGKPLKLKTGRFGKFVACSGYPECKYTAHQGKSGAESEPEQTETGEACPQCGKPLKVRSGRFGKFIACSGYPECKYIARNAKAGKGAEEPPVDTGEKCPKCGKPLQLKAGRFGKFVACSGYPECKYIARNAAKIGVKCPKCGHDLVEKRSKKRRTFYGCSNYPECKFATSNRPLPDPCPECGKMLVASGRSGTKCTECDYRGKAAEPEPEAVAA